MDKFHGASCKYLPFRGRGALCRFRVVQVSPQPSFPGSLNYALPSMRLPTATSKLSIRTVLLAVARKMRIELIYSSSTARCTHLIGTACCTHHPIYLSSHDRWRSGSFEDWLSRCAGERSTSTFQQQRPCVASMYSSCMYSQPASSATHQDSTQKHLATDLLDCSKKSQKKSARTYTSITGTDHRPRSGQRDEVEGDGAERGDVACIGSLFVHKTHAYKCYQAVRFGGAGGRPFGFQTHSSRASLCHYACTTPRGTVFSPASCLIHHCKGVVRELRRVRSVHSTRTGSCCS